MNASTLSNKYNHNIDALRIFCTLAIVYYHIFSNLNYGDNSYYIQLGLLCKQANLFVELFLVVGGFYLWKSIQKKKEQSYIVFMLDKVVRLWPVLFFATTLTFFIGKLRWEDLIFDITFLRNTGISLTNTGIVWYIGPFFWSMLLIAALFKVLSKGQAILILAVITYFSYVINLNYLQGGLGREIVFSFISLSMLRVTGGVGIGTLTAIVLEAFKELFEGRKENHFVFAISTVTEIICIFLILKITLLGGVNNGNNSFLFVIICIILLVSFVENKGLISQTLNKPWITKLSKPCYSIYVMQQFAFYILKDSLWNDPNYVNDHPRQLIFITMLCTACIGIITYFVIEKRMISFWEKIKIKYNF